jgi:hypothetical protein
MVKLLGGSGKRPTAGGGISACEELSERRESERKRHLERAKNPTKAAATTMVDGSGIAVMVKVLPVLLMLLPT